MIPFVFILACSPTPESKPTVPETESTETAPIEAKPRIVILGDSLTAGMGIAVDLAYPTLLEKKLTEAQLPTEILNAGVSGDTTAGGLRRLDWLLSQPAQLVIVELGANDGMRGVPIEDIDKNLRQIIQKVQEKSIDVMLMEIQLPPNYGAEYTEAFRTLYPTISKDLNVPLLPFLLEKVAGDPKLNQGDGIHPTKEGHILIADTVYPDILKWRTAWKAE